jgi:tetratricopeptide (TPR) repeat protein
LTPLPKGLAGKLEIATIGILLLLATGPLFADVARLVSEGTALYDAGQYDAAIAKYKAALAEDPSSDIATYELALAYQAKGDVAQCQALLEPRLRTKSRYQAAMHVILGNCYDGGGDPARAIATYRKGLKIDGNQGQLLYNLAVTLAGRGEYDEARKLLKKDLTLDPKHRSAHYLLGRVLEEQNFRVPATLSYLRFLSLEPSGDRAKEAATRAVTLLRAGIEVKDKETINITIDSHTRKEEGDYSAVEMMMALAGARADSGRE